MQIPTPELVHKKRSLSLWEMINEEAKLHNQPSAAIWEVEDKVQQLIQVQVPGHTSAEV